MVVGSVLLAMLATALAFPTSVGVCLFTQGVGPRWLGGVMLLLIHGMTAIPTVVYGFVAVMVLVPVMRRGLGRHRFFPPVGRPDVGV